MKILVPMAGRGSRLLDRSPRPKPLTIISGRPMIAWSLDSLSGLNYSEIIFVTLRQHEQEFGITSMLRELVRGDVRVLQLDSVTEGQLCSVLAAREFIESEEDLLIASCDTYVISDLSNDIEHRQGSTRGIISVASLPGEQWSFARVDMTGKVIEVAEKRRISNHASTGLYYFSSGKEFLAAADQIVSNQERVRGEYYVMPVYQKYIDAGADIEISIARESWDMGNPEAFALAEQHLSKLAYR